MILARPDCGSCFLFCDQGNAGGGVFGLEAIINPVEFSSDYLSLEDRDAFSRINGAVRMDSDGPAEICRSVHFNNPNGRSGYSASGEEVGINNSGSGENRSWFHIDPTQGGKRAAPKSQTGMLRETNFVSAG